MATPPRHRQVVHRVQRRNDSGKEDGSGQVVSPFQKGALASSSFPLAFFTDLDMETRYLSVAIHGNGVG